MEKARLKKFIQKNKALFWWVKDKEKISEEILVEAILNYGTRESVKELFDILGMEHVAEIFFKQIRKKRNNYNPRTINFFSLYFGRYARRSSHKRTA